MSIFALDKLNVRHISTSGLVDILERVPRVSSLTLRVSPSLELIWRPVASYSDLAVDTLRYLVTLTFDLLTLVSGHTWRLATHVVNLSSLDQVGKFDDPTAIHSWAMSSAISHRIPLALTVRSQPATAHAPYHVTICIGRANFPIYLKSLNPICLFTIQLLWLYNKNKLS